MATNIRPLHDRVIIRRIEESSNQTAGGLFIPDTAKEKPQEGEVIAAGEGKYKEDGTRQALDVKAGDRVLFGKYSGLGDQARRRGIHHHARRRDPRHHQPGRRSSKISGQS